MGSELLSQAGTTAGPRVAVIATFYNLESYVARCVSSILGQSYANIAVLLVNDGSSDGTLSELQQYRVDPRVRVLDKPNGGPASARNYGIGHTDADWVTFVDGDDYLSPYAVEGLVRAQLATGVSLVSGTFEVVRDRARSEIGWSREFHWDVVAGESMVEAFCFGNLDEMSCNKLARTSLYREIPFPDGRYYEDLAVGGRHLCEASRVAIIQEPTYAYAMREGSVVHKKAASMRQAEDYLWAIGELLKPFAEREGADRAGISYRRARAYARLHTLLTSVVDDPGAAANMDAEVLADVRSYVSHGMDPRVPRRETLRLRLLARAPRLYDAAIRAYDAVAKGVR